MNPHREKEIRERSQIVKSHIEVDMVLDLLKEIDRLREELKKLDYIRLA
jgi:hypothetical protein